MLEARNTPLIDTAREAIRSDGEAGGFALTAGLIEAAAGPDPEKDHILLWIGRE